MLYWSLPVAFWVLMFFVFLGVSAVRGAQRTARIDRITRSPYLPRVLMEYGYWMMDAARQRIGSPRRHPERHHHAVAAVHPRGRASCSAPDHIAEGGWALVFGFMCDAWDGIVARKTGKSSVAGEFFDATVDRYNDLFAFLGLMYYYRNDPLPLALATLALVGSTLTSYTRAKGEAVGVDPNVGWMQRHERGVYLGLATTLAPVVAWFTERDAVHPHYLLVVARWR